MNSQLSDDASLPHNRQLLENEIATIEGLITETAEKIKATIASEDPAHGIWHAQEIHQLQQQKLILQTRRDLRKVRVRRLALEASEDS